MNIHHILSLDLTDMSISANYIACESSHEAKRFVAKRLGNRYLVCWKGLAYDEPREANNWEMLQGEALVHVTVLQ